MTECEVPSSSASGNESFNGCVILGANATVPWDNPYDLISLETVTLVAKVKVTVFLPVLFVIGLTTNVLNAVVFARQGLSERINMCLFLLSLTDLASISYFWALYAEDMYLVATKGDPAYLGYRPVYAYFVKHNLVGMYSLFYASSFLNAVISTERCVCVLFPFHAKKCVSTRALAAVLLTLMLLVIGLYFLLTKQYVFRCYYEVAADRISWGVGVTEYFFKNRAMLQALGVFYGLCLFVGCPLVVCVTTLITSVKLYRVISWRKTTSSLSSSTTPSAPSLSAKEVGVTKMLICVSIEFVVLSIPFVLVYFAPVVNPQLSSGGLYTNAFRSLISLAEISSMACSSINFFRVLPCWDSLQRHAQVVSLRETAAGVKTHRYNWSSKWKA
jgi:hypothetical protein